MKRHYYFSLLTLFMTIGCTTQPNYSPRHQTWQQPSQWPETSLFSVYQQWQGVPYRLGGTNKAGIDCSAFVQIAFQEAWQQSLPRTTRLQSQQGQVIRYQDAQYGDLVFFKTSRSTRHVGIYLGNQYFMHASTSQGVIISRLDNPYWASKLWQFRRIENPPAVVMNNPTEVRR
ncbi:C40 family peptidase [Vibrio cincinnatiensis]|uniref:C40 family peptidase n=1 Tax=Vibrio cincinnatiensis TaxID=675 RepID=UPI001EDDFBFE|nr:NlpC/P60 family protein [Vibrio cincinnatiensis]MCG3721333.1 peptidase P60 [Vibrio cincinnatiensis]MCG3736227.1 peptidase P60 [Vibrio cincinnatiensis]MCG3742710.1 peptidase P60 [Vibrio cincinnatiensis]